MQTKRVTAVLITLLAYVRLKSHVENPKVKLQNSKDQSTNSTRPVKQKTVDTMPAVQLHQVI